MTDLWVSVPGTDIWEMADHHNPVFVYDSKAVSLEFQPILENDSSLTSNAHGHSTVSSLQRISRNRVQSIESQLHPCSKCIADEKKCVKFVITCYSTDWTEKQNSVRHFAITERRWSWSSAIKPMTNRRNQRCSSFCEMTVGKPCQLVVGSWWLSC